MQRHCLCILKANICISKPHHKLLNTNLVSRKIQTSKSDVSWYLVEKPPKYSKSSFNWRCDESGAKDEGENHYSHLSLTV